MQFVEPSLTEIAKSERNFSVKFDNRDTHKPGWKFAEYELKGVPVRIAVSVHVIWRTEPWKWRVVIPKKKAVYQDNRS
jgi:prolyl-tRNA synthetase